MCALSSELGRLARLAAALLLAGLVAVAHAAPAAAQAAPGAPPAQVQHLLDLLADPAVRDWLDKQRAGGPALPPSGLGQETAPPGTAGSYMASRTDAVRQHIRALVAAAPDVPDEIERLLVILSLDLEERGFVEVLLLVVGFVILGFGAEWAFYRATRRFREWFVAIPLGTVAERLRAVGIRFAYGLGMVAAFAVGSVGAFLLFSWPPLLRQIVLGYLAAFLVLRLALVVARFLLAPGGPRFRLIPMATAAAWFWVWRIGAFVGWFAFAWVTLDLLGALGFEPVARRLIAYACTLVLLGLAIESAWRRPLAAAPAPGDPSAARRRTGRGVGAWLLTLYFLVLWTFWVTAATPLFWLAVAALSVPAAAGVIRRSVNHVLRPPEAVDAGARPPSLAGAALERGLVTALIIGAALFLADRWGLDLVEMTAADTLATRLLRGALSAVVIVLVADFAWHIFKAVVDRKLAGADDPEAGDERRRARLRTLLPVLRNVVFVVLLVMVALMVLASLGIDIGPLIAGAGVVGVALGFGAQTLVRDIISGMFYLADDAFRVGEYISSGNYKGTVESFSLRSVKLRHHRGPLYTVPFGVLGAIQNMSRDWVIDKLAIEVTYDTDIDKAKKIVKEIGKQLAADPEFAPKLIEPLKMQGVEQFGDYGIQIRLKMKTKPGDQFTIRRRAYALIKRAFDANGIKFAQPTVQVAGGEAAPAAAAKRAIDLAEPTAAQ
jgi:small-conductance mechanosensitive channel